MPERTHDLDVKLTHFVHDSVEIKIDPDNMPCQHCHKAKDQHGGPALQCLFDTTHYVAMSPNEVFNLLLGTNSREF